MSQKNSGQFMASFFWDSQGVLHRPQEEASPLLLGDSYSDTTIGPVFEHFGSLNGVQQLAKSLTNDRKAHRFPVDVTLSVLKMSRHACNTMEKVIKTEHINLAKFVKRQKVHGGTDDNVVLTATFAVDVPKTGFFVGLTVTPNLVYCPGDVGNQAREIAEDAGLFTVTVLSFDAKQEVVIGDIAINGGLHWIPASDVQNPKVIKVIVNGDAVARLSDQIMSALDLYADTGEICDAIEAKQ
jgi:hypothetical protein